MPILYTLLLGCTLLFAGCAKTIVVLLPDDNGTVGAIIVQNSKTQRIVAEKDNKVDITTQSISEPIHMPAAEIEAMFGNTLRALPMSKP